MKDSINSQYLKKFIKEALTEDIGTGDITTNAIISRKEITAGQVIAKGDLVLCGLNVFKNILLYVDKNIKITLKFTDGKKIRKGNIILTFSGNTRSLLAAERVALNILQRLSGIATLTSKFIEKVPKSIKILDTRKTTPGIRFLEKYAVRCGGGFNHRFGLYDAVLIKDNHIKAAGSITRAVEKTRKRLSTKQKIEVEVKSMKEVEEALKTKCDIIMLDNMSLDLIKKAVSAINRKAKIEVSGNIVLRNIKKIADTGVDYISIGALTHSAPAVDISMVFD